MTKQKIITLQSNHRRFALMLIFFPFSVISNCVIEILISLAKIQEIKTESLGSCDKFSNQA